MGINVTILTINAGSSSIKFDLLRAAEGTLESRLKLSVTNLGQAMAHFSTTQPDKETQTRVIDASDQAAVIQTMLGVVTDQLKGAPLTAVGHRIVHGGPRYSQPELITDELEQELDKLSAFDPEHAPMELELIRVLKHRFPTVTHVACFDTSFFHNLPTVAQLTTLPRTYQTQGLRRYGFHGLSYEYLLSAFRAVAGESAAQGNIIFAHLGSGASMAAVRGGKPIDTTMGFTPASGIMMSSRSGDIDPGIARYLHEQADLSFDAYDHMVNFESGLLGVSDLSADMLTLLNNEESNTQAAEAVALFCYQAKKAIGALAASVGGLNSLVFSGGIGEQSAPIRARICAGLEFLGIELDEQRNSRHAECISSPGSRVGVHVLATDEAQTIARLTLAAITTKGDYS